MNDRIQIYLDGLFAPYSGITSIAELKDDLQADLQEKYAALRAGGLDDQSAFEQTVDSIGDIEETMLEMANLSQTLKRQTHINFKGSALQQSDFAGVTAHGGHFDASALCGSDFSGADLTGSTFTASDLKNTCFDGANLTDCRLTSSSLENCSFRRAILVRTNFSTSGLAGAIFADSRLADVNLGVTDLRGVTFRNCLFEGVDFRCADLRGQSFSGMTFHHVRFDKTALDGALFSGAVLRNVSFSPYMFSKKFYKAMGTVSFEGASMDKLTYAALRGMGTVNLSGVNLLP